SACSRLGAAPCGRYGATIRRSTVRRTDGLRSFVTRQRQDVNRRPRFELRSVTPLGPPLGQLCAPTCGTYGSGTTFSKTATVLNGPFSPIPSVVTVSVLPSSETLYVPFPRTLPSTSAPASRVTESGRVPNATAPGGTPGIGRPFMSTIGRRRPSGVIVVGRSAQA